MCPLQKLLTLSYILGQSQTCCHTRAPGWIQPVAQDELDTPTLRYSSESIVQQNFRLWQNTP